MRISAKTLALGALVALIAAAAMYQWSRPQMPTAVAISIDASGSTGDDYTARYVPTAAWVIGQLPSNCRICVTRFGGVRQVVMAGALTPESAQQLRSFLMSTTPFPPDIKGSPISTEAALQLEWLAQQGGRGVLILFTDGEEQHVREALSRPSSQLGDTTVIICYPRMPNPRVAESVRQMGAQVIIARTPDQVHRVIQSAVLGNDFWRRLAFYSSFAALLFGLASLGGAFLSWRRSKQESPLPAELAEPRPVPLKESGDDILKLPTKRVILKAELEGHPLLSAQRVLQCNDLDRFIVACSRRVTTLSGRTVEADLHIPPKLLGPSAADLGITIQLQPSVSGWFRLRITNFGHAPILTNGRVISPNDSLLIPTQGELVIDISRNRRILISIAPQYDEEEVYHATHSQ